VTGVSGTGNPEGTSFVRENFSIGVVIPALNEEDAIGHVVGAIPDWIDAVVVADNGSTDRTAETARMAGATVVAETERGYGAACLTAIAALPPVEIVVFIDGDNSDYAEDMAELVDPIIANRYDFVLGSRVMGKRESGALTPQQIFGNWLATRLIQVIWGATYTDLGPYRAIRKDALDRLDMIDRNYGWTVEMQIKAAQNKLRITEVPARYRRRIGVSKVSGTVKGTILAGYKILATIARYALLRRRAQPAN